GSRHHRLRPSFHAGGPAPRRDGLAGAAGRGGRPRRGAAPPARRPCPGPAPGPGRPCRRSRLRLARARAGAARPHRGAAVSAAAAAVVAPASRTHPRLAVPPSLIALLLLSLPLVTL